MLLVSDFAVNKAWNIFSGKRYVESMHHRRVKGFLLFFSHHRYTQLGASIFLTTMQAASHKYSLSARRKIDRRRFFGLENAALWKQVFTEKQRRKTRRMKNVREREEDKAGEYRREER